MLTTSQIRRVTPETARTVLVIGSGAVENSWRPVFRALSIFTGTEISDPDEANLIMARLIFNVRFLADGLNKCKPENYDQIYNDLFRSRGNLAKFRKILAAEIKWSTEARALPLRKPQLKSIESQIERPAAALTTNWEISGFDELSIDYTLPLHGLVDKPDSLYLPSEATFDRNSSSEIEAQHNRIHYEALMYLSHCPKVVFWGIGINPLDTELTALISQSFGQKHITNQNHSVSVYDLNPERVARRLVLFGVASGSIRQNQC